jgi:UDP-N-acetylmuramoylalanine--D-glutamate ligase
VVGLARSGAAAALALRARGHHVIGLDAGSPAGAAALADAGVELRLGASGGEGADPLDRASAVVKSPGVPAEAAVVAAARERGLPVLGELELAWRLLPNELIAVTGTNGKTTTVELIGHIHRRAGLPVAVAGNVGTALSSLVGALDSASTIVCETSSFQLEDTIAFAPEAAVLLNITPDHLDRHGTLERYTQAKARVFANQDGEDLAVLPHELAGELAPLRARVLEFGPCAAGAALCERDGRLWWDEQPLMALEEIRLRGRHNVANAMAAACVCLARGIEREAVRDGLATFAGVAHRLQEVARIDGVLYVNDSKATNVASTLVALDAFARDPVRLILGGQGKGQDFAALRDAVARGCAAVYLIGEDAGAIARALEGAGPPLEPCAEIERALARARAQARAGEVVLLSPACASFDQFADFEARGERFRELVREMEA